MVEIKKDLQLPRFVGELWEEDSGALYTLVYAEGVDPVACGLQGNKSAREDYLIFSCVGETREEVERALEEAWARYREHVGA